MKQRLNKRAAFEQGRLFVGLHFKFYFCSMKCRFLLWVILPVLLASCSPGRYPASLLTADSLSSVRPDSALCLLARLAADTADAPLSHRMYYRLLCIKAADKAYLPHTSDSLIRPVLHYYIEGGDPRLLPEAYYYAGRVYRDLGNDLQALSCFQKALEPIRQNGDTDVHLKSKIYSQRATLYAYRKMYREALAMYQKVLKISTSTCDSVDMLFALRDIANMYRELHRPDSVLPYFKRAKQIADMLQRMDLSRMMQSQLAYAYLEVQAYDSARAALTEALLQVKRPNRSAVYSIAAHFYKTIGKTDSADYYNRKLLEIGTVYAKEKAYRELTGRLIRQVGNPPLDTLFNGWLQYADSLRTLDRKANELKTYADYDYLKSEQENARLKEQNAHNRFIIWIGGLVIVTLLASLAAFGQYYRRVRQEKQEQQRRYMQIIAEQRKKNEMLEAYLQEKKQLEKMQQEMQKADGVQDMKKKRRLELINHVLEKNRIETEEDEEAREALMHSTLYAELQQRAHAPRGDGFVTSEEWDELRRLSATAYPHFFEHLELLCAPNENEWHVSLLIKLLFRPADIARLTGLKPSSISSIRVRLYKKATGESGKAESWDQIVLSL